METQFQPDFNVTDSKTLIQRLRVRFIQSALGFIIISNLAVLFAIAVTGNLAFTPDNSAVLLSIMFSFAFFLIVSRRQLIRVISVIVIAYLSGLSVYLFIVVEDVNVAYVLLSLTALVGATITERLGFRLMLSTIFFTVLGLSIASGLQITSNDITFSVTAISNNFATGLVPVTIAAIARYVLAELNSALNVAERSATLLVASAEIGRNVSAMLDLNVLLDRTVDIIRDRFAFFHVSIFLTDENLRYAHLTASTGDVGERMLARGHRLSVNADSVVGRSAQSQDVIIARDTDAESGHSFNELLPFTRSELAVPIIDNDGIVGVVDIQSRLADAFTGTEIDALRVIANQLATAIRNARLFEDKERSIRENKRLFIEAETNLREIQRLNRQLTKQAWSDYLRTDRRVDGVTLSDKHFTNSAEWSAEMLDASRRRRAITGEENGKRKVAVPIELRGEVVGAIELETDSNNKKDDLVDMVRTVSQSLAVSLDNARLFEESNEATAQEQRVSEIVSQYQSAESVDDLLRLTLQGLAETLGAETASIRLGVMPDTAGQQLDDILDSRRPSSSNGGTPDAS